MKEIILKNTLIELVASATENTKSEVNFDVLDVKTKKKLFEIYTDNEDLLNGHFEFIINDVSEKCDDRKMEEALKLFVDFLFISFPIHKICYKTNQKNISTIKILMKLGFEVEACLKQDIYLDGEYVDKIVLAIFRK